jgi:hypothetical protein
MRVTRHLLSPLGGIAALFSLFLPWVHLECGETRVDPDLLQLAEQKGELYVFVLLAVVLLVVALGMVSFRRRGWGMGTILTACLGIAGWIYLWFKKDELGRQTMEIEGLSGGISGWLQQLQVEPAAGYYLYLAAMLVGLVGALIWLAGSGRKPDAPT